MAKRLVLLAAGLPLALVPVAQARVPAATVAHVAHDRAQADILPVKNDKGKWKGGGCTYQFKANHKGFKEKYKCK